MNLQYNKLYAGLALLLILFSLPQLSAAPRVKIGIDVLVHGEFERNDMVEYFGEQLSGFAFTKNGWVQSYGSRCVKPPASCVVSTTSTRL